MEVGVGVLVCRVQTILRVHWEGLNKSLNEQNRLGILVHLLFP